MMKRILMTMLAVMVLSISAGAVEISDELLDAADSTTREIAEQRQLKSMADLTEGALEIFETIRPELGQRIRAAVKSAVLLVTVVIAAGLAESFFSAAGGALAIDPVVLAGVFAMAGIALRDMDGLLESARSMLTELDSFTTALLPTLFAAVAATGAVTTASAQQLVAAWLSAALVRFVSTVLMPLLLCYLALVTASAVLPGDPLSFLAESLKKGMTWLLGGILSAFTAYLSLTHVLSGSADAMTLRLTKATLSSVVPVVGDILSGTAETVLAGAGLLKNAVGIVGLLGVLSVSLLPFLAMLAQYLCYRTAAAAASVTGSRGLNAYLGKLGGAFGLLMGMVGSCVLLVFISVFAAIAVVTP